RLDQRDGGRDAAQKLLVDAWLGLRLGSPVELRRRGGSRGRLGPRRWQRRWRRWWRGCRVAVAVRAGELEQPGEPWMGSHDLARAALEERPPFGRDCLRVLEVLLEQGSREAAIQAIHVLHPHTFGLARPIPA